MVQPLGSGGRLHTPQKLEDFEQELVMGLAARDIRTDRILDEVQATGGDLRRVCTLFGLSVAAASHYTTGLDPPELTNTRQ